MNIFKVLLGIFDRISLVRKNFSWCISSFSWILRSSSHQYATFAILGSFSSCRKYSYLGRCYAWARRENAERLLSITHDERNELFDIIIPIWSRANQILWWEFRPNIAILSNTVLHLHAHLIPKQRSVSAYGEEFSDPRPDGNYAPYPKKQLSHNVLELIRSDIQKVIL